MGRIEDELDPQFAKSIYWMEQDMADMTNEIATLRFELAAEREKSAEYEYALKKYAADDNWQQREVYTKYGQYDEWQWCDMSVLPSEIAQDVLEKWAKPEEE